MADALRPPPHPVLLTDVYAAVPGCTADSSSGASVAGVQVTGASLDSRSIRPGDLYLALPGRVTHGARYAAPAVAAGAVAIVTDPSGAPHCAGLGVPVLVVSDPRALSGPIAAAIHGWPARSLQLLGVTGTNGKSTVTAMVQAGLTAAGRSTGAIGTLGVSIGEERSLGPRTTPEATDLQAILAVMRAAEVQSVIMEVSSIALDEHRVDGFGFDVAGFTQMSQDHLDYHGNMESYFAAKAQLFTPDHASMGVVGIDDEYGRRLADEASIPLLTWSIDDPSADWHADDVRSVATGSAVSITGRHGDHALLHVPLPGRYNVANALCAFGMLRSIGVDAEAAVRGIGGVSVPGRMQVVARRVDSASGAGVVGVVDYAHTPDAITRVLEGLAGGGRVIAVLGAGGDRDAGKRPLMGAAAARLADVLVVTDDNPRTEDPSAIRAAIIEGATSIARDRGVAVLERGDRAEAIGLAVELARPGDTVVVLGKGHETGQEVAGVVNAFDDTEVLSAALRSEATQ